MRKVVFVLTSVVVVDAATKFTAPRTDWTFHAATAFPWKMLLCCAVLIAWVLTSGWWVSAIALGGAVGNTIWALTGGCPNPFVIPVWDGWLAFNAADVALWIGGILTCVVWSVTLIRAGTLRRFWAAVRANGWSP